jgi:hypothetical protein
VIPEQDADRSAIPLVVERVDLGTSVAGLDRATCLIRSIVLPETAQAPAPSAAQAAQRDWMKSCNADAGMQKLAGDARKSFMADGLAGKTTAAPETGLTPQQAKMKSCNADSSAKSLKGADRKAFLNTCLKG